MQFWQTLLKKPSGQKSMDDFALAIDKIPKIVFSHTLKDTEWDKIREVENEINQLISSPPQKNS
jgi:hypothetical protein